MMKVVLIMILIKVPLYCVNTFVFLRAVSATLCLFFAAVGVVDLLKTAKFRQEVPEILNVAENLPDGTWFTQVA